jgi:hypothetical protein
MPLTKATHSGIYGFSINVLNCGAGMENKRTGI